jgi:hypothetical protein
MSLSRFLLLASACCLLWCPLLSSAVRVNISNVAPHVDIHGEQMDIHDGDTLYHEGVYHYYGSAYGLCHEFDGPNGCADTTVGACGFNLNHNVSLFTSRDLKHWTPAREPPFQFARDFPIPVSTRAGTHSNSNRQWRPLSLTVAPCSLLLCLQGIMFCPKVLYNRLTSRFVLWINWIDAKAGFSAAYYAVAVSDSAYGPFKLVTVNVTTLTYPIVGDFAFWKDDDTQEAYIIYTGAIDKGHLMSVEKLSDDYTATLGAQYNSGVFGNFVEAPSMFRHEGVYYASFGTCCCYVTFYSASAPLGPYTAVQVMTEGIPAQQTNIVRYYDERGRERFLWQGDRWQSAPDRLKGHDLTYSGVVHFNRSGAPQPIPFTDWIIITVNATEEETEMEEREDGRQHRHQRSQ